MEARCRDTWFQARGLVRNLSRMRTVSTLPSAGRVEILPGTGRVEILPGTGRVETLKNHSIGLGLCMQG